VCDAHLDIREFDHDDPRLGVERAIDVEYQRFLGLVLHEAPDGPGLDEAPLQPHVGVGVHGDDLVGEGDRGPVHAVLDLLKEDLGVGAGRRPADGPADSERRHDVPPGPPPDRGVLRVLGRLSFARLVRAVDLGLAALGLAAALGGEGGEGGEGGKVVVKAPGVVPRDIGVDGLARRGELLGGELGDVRHRGVVGGLWTAAQRHVTRGGGSVCARQQRQRDSP
jgi:hypothetical protein